MRSSLLKTMIAMLIILVSIMTVNAATLTCTQISDASMEISQFSSKTIEIKCTASGGSVSNIQITPNADPSSGLSISASQTISSTISDSSSSTAKWSATGDSPNDYDVSYSISSDSTNAWSGSSTTQIEVVSPASLRIEYLSPPSTYSSDDDLDVRISNIGGTAATNVKLKLNSGSKINYPSSIPAGSQASYSWTSSTGYDSEGTYETKVYISDSLQDSASVSVAAPADPTCSDGIQNQGEDGVDCGDVCSNTCETGDGGSSGGGSGGAAGGGGSGEIENFGLLNGTGIMTIENSKYAFTEISVEVNQLIQNAKLFVEKKSFVDENLYPAIDGTVYQYLKVSSPTIGDNALEGGTIRFRVNKTWISENGLDAGRMFLLRFNNNNWVQQTTVRTGSDNDFVYYTANYDAFGMFAISSLNEVELDYLSFSNLVPQLVDLQMVIESGLSDSLMITKIEGYYSSKLDIKESIEHSKELAKGLSIKREVKNNGESSIMKFSITNNLNESASFMSVEAVPKSIVYDIYELYDFNPRIYDLIIREDPVIEWSFGKADTAIVAWEIKDLGPGETASFSYSLDAVFDINKYPAPIIVKPSFVLSKVEAAEENILGNSTEESSASKLSSKTKIIGLLGMLILFSLISFFLNKKFGGNNHGLGEESPNKKDLNENQDSDNINEKKSGSKPEPNHHATTQIGKFIEKQQAAGISDTGIRAKLLRVGWSKDKIDDAFMKLKS